MFHLVSTNSLVFKKIFICLFTFSVCTLDDKTGSLQVNSGQLNGAFVLPSSSAPFHPTVFSCPYQASHIQQHTHTPYNILSFFKSVIPYYS